MTINICVNLSGSKRILDVMDVVNTQKNEDMTMKE